MARKGSGTMTEFDLSSQCHDVDRSRMRPTYQWTGTRGRDGTKIQTSDTILVDHSAVHHNLFVRLIHTIVRTKHQRSSTPEALRSHQRAEDELSVRDGTCTFQVQYLGSVDVHDSKGIRICEEAMKVLKSKESRSQSDRRRLPILTPDTEDKPLSHRWAKLNVGADCLRVIDDITQEVIVEDAIETVSYCAPTRNNDKSFAYIASTGTSPRRWICHGFLGLNASGDRIGHAVGCAFSANLVKKRERANRDRSAIVSTNIQQSSARADLPLSENTTTVVELNREFASPGRPIEEPSKSELAGYSMLEKSDDEHQVWLQMSTT